MKKQSNVGVLLVQLGTPDAPTPAAVRRYLAQFLSDRRVVDTPRWWWLPLLHGLILRRRPARSAALYQKIWREDGLSPLLYYSERQTAGVAAALAGRATVQLGMCYGNPSLAAALDALIAAGVEKLLLFPLYPQFSASTHGAMLDAVHRYFQHRRAIPALRMAPPFFDHPRYIDLLAQQIRPTPNVGPTPNDDDPFYLFSFHGLPQRHVDEGDPYEKQCRTTAQRLAEALALEDRNWGLGFQSRFGREPWLLPATDHRLTHLPAEGHRRVTVLCPGFVSDCLETLEEIGQTEKKRFLAAGGEQYHVIPCLNDTPTWIETLAHMVHDELSGWAS